MAHGDHWEAITGNAEEAFAQIIPRAISNGRLVGTSGEFLFQHDDGPELPERISGLVYPEDTPLRFIVLACSDSTKAGKAAVLYTAYPLLFEGCRAVVTLRECQELEMQHEATIRAELDNQGLIWFFDPFYFLNRERYQAGDRFEISLAGLAYTLREATSDTIRVESGGLMEMERKRLLEEDPSADPDSIQFVEVSIKDACWLMPRDPADDSEFRGIVEEVTCCDVTGVSFCRVVVSVIRTEDQNLRLAIFASETVLDGYRPDVGDRVEGCAWIQGRLLNQPPG